MTANTRRSIIVLPLVLAASLGFSTARAAPAQPQPQPNKIFDATIALQGLLPVHVDKHAGRILVTLPPAGDDGVSARFLYATSLRTGLGAAPTFLDRGRVGNTQILAFRRYGKKIAVVFENPRFHGAATGAAASPDFATSIAWMGDIAATLPDGRLVVDLSGFLTTDAIGIADSLDQGTDTFGVGGGQGAGKGFKLDEKRSAADPDSVKDFPDNLEIDAVQTYVSATPGDEVANIAPAPGQVSFTVHHSFVRLPGPGFQSRAFDPRIAGFGTQVVDFGEPLGNDVVREYANRFRLDKTDPGAARSRVRKPIVYYVDWRAPEPIRSPRAGPRREGHGQVRGDEVARGLSRDPRNRRTRRRLLSHGALRCERPGLVGGGGPSRGGRRQPLGGHASTRLPAAGAVGHRSLPQGRVGAPDRIPEASVGPLAVPLRPVQRLDR